MGRDAGPLLGLVSLLLIKSSGVFRRQNGALVYGVDCRCSILGWASHEFLGGAAPGTGLVHS
jgi:hypothetical protein